MTEQYDNAVARHYSAYRPPLHGPILARTIERGETFSIGIDIGCGTGYSTVALADYCDRVFGVDPSESMLADAEEHPQVTYVCAKGDDLGGIPTRTVNIVTFAGSLYYTKTKELRQELNKLCSPGAAVIVYDFEVLLGKVLTDLGMDIPAVGSDYDHAMNILDWKEYPAIMLDTGHLHLELSSEELGHVLLADSNRFAAFSEMFETRNPFEPVVNILEGRSNTHDLNVDIYFARYTYSPARSQ